MYASNVFFGSFDFCCYCHVSHVNVSRMGIQFVWKDMLKEGGGAGWALLTKVWILVS
jgi:hypothetical protein